MDRLWALGRWPGINGDEAWYGAQLLRWHYGETHSWRTPTGNLSGPLHLGLLSASLAVFPRELWALRVPAVISSLGAIAVVFVALRRAFDRETAVIGALLQACIPAGIVYARLGWDSSHGPLLGALGLWCALEARIAALAAIFALSLWCHPSNTIVAPFYAIVALAALRARGRGIVSRQAVVALLALVAGAALLAATSPRIASTRLVQWQKLISPAFWGRHFADLCDFLLGIAPVAHTAGPALEDPTGTAALVFALVAAAVIATGMLRGSRLSTAGIGIVAGFVLMAVAVAFLPENMVFGRRSDRYALGLVTPAVCAGAVLMRMLSGGRMPQGSGWAAALAVCVLALGFVQTAYFGGLANTGSLAHRTYWTGDAEPKDAAWRLIASQLAPGSKARVVAEDWWILQPLSFLAAGTDASVSMLRRGVVPHTDRDLFLVGFSGGPVEALGDRFANDGTVQRWSIGGTGREEVLQVVRVEPLAPAKADEERGDVQPDSIRQVAE